MEDTEPRVQRLFQGPYRETDMGPQGLASAGLCGFITNMTKSINGKKTIFLLSILFLAIFFFYPKIVKATSGACSSHGGVSCSAGADFDGSVICNDGWRDSNVSYLSMVECKNENYSCTSEEWQNLSKKYKLKELFLQMQDLTDKMTAIAINAGNLSKSVDYSTFYLLQVQYNSRETLYDSALNAAERECKAIGADRASQQNYEKIRSDFYSTQIKNERDNLAQLEQEKQKLTENYINVLNNLNEQRYTCSANSTLNGNSCKCNSGYFIYSDYPSRCINPTDYCKLKYGNHIFANDTKCICESEYNWDGVKCIKIEDKSTPTFTTSINSPTKTVHAPKQQLILTSKNQSENVTESHNEDKATTVKFKWWQRVLQWFSFKI